MKFAIKQIGPHLWNSTFAENAHMACFGEKREGTYNRIDYALLAINHKTDEAIAYMTCNELDAKTVYWQYGGSFPPIKDTVNSWRVYNDFKEWHTGKYDRISTYIRNDNRAMLKMASKIGFRIVGTKTVSNMIFLDHLMELNHSAENQDGKID